MEKFDQIFLQLKNHDKILAGSVKSVRISVIGIFRSVFSTNFLLKNFAHKGLFNSAVQKSEFYQNLTILEKSKNFFYYFPPVRPPHADALAASGKVRRVGHMGHAMGNSTQRHRMCRFRICVPRGAEVFRNAPQLQLTVLANSDKGQPLLRVHGDAVDWAHMGLDRVKALPCGQMPHFHLAIPSAGQHGGQSGGVLGQQVDLKGPKNLSQSIKFNPFEVENHIL